MPSSAHRLTAACIVATIAFVAYTRTLVPGVEPGDSAAFQATVLWPEVSARQAYPLYYGLARPLIGAFAPANPARGLNLVSALWGAAAVGSLVAAAAAITRSLPAGVAAGLLLAFSYTFWSHAIIAEVYTLHLLLVGLCLLTVHAYGQRPSTARLVVVFGVYAVAFGNHLSMILLAPALAWGLVRLTPDWRTLLAPRTVGAGLAIAGAASLQYLPLLLAVWQSPDAPPATADRLAAFWFDVTKSDWRASMVLGVDGSQWGDRLGMWWFDLQQQFGIAGTLLAGVGAAALMRRTPIWGQMVLLAWITNTAFALTYNVGDAHVFFLPSHYLTALAAGAVLAIPTPRQLALTATAALVAYAGWRGWDTWPAVDRHLDRRGEQLVARLTSGLGGNNATLVTQLDWQLENAVSYHVRFVRQSLPWERLSQVLLRWPQFVEATHRAGRDVVISAEAARAVSAAYGNAYAIVGDPVPPAIGVTAAVAQIPRGAPYVLTMLPPLREVGLDPETLREVIATLSGGRRDSLPTGAYGVIAGLAGEAPRYARGEARPFRERFNLVGDAFTIRVDGWVTTDTFRRAGFGHVLRGRERVLIVERGLSLVWFQADGTPTEPLYAAGLYAARPRFRVAASAPKLAQAEP